MAEGHLTISVKRLVQLVTVTPVIEIQNRIMYGTPSASAGQARKKLFFM
jgi:hypothetical protein